MKLRIAVKIPLKDIRDIDHELERICAFLVAIPLENGLVRLGDNHYDVVKRGDCDPVELYSWLTQLPDNVSLQWFNKEWEKWRKK
jgi:hypothetical protein